MKNYCDQIKLGVYSTKKQNTINAAYERPINVTYYPYS